MKENEFNLGAAQGAVDYLASVGYSDARVLEPGKNHPRISYEPDSGDGTWESGMAAWNHWVIKGKGKCCSGASKNAKYCSTCGAGLKRMVWTRDEKNDDFINFLEEQSEIDLRNSNGLRIHDSSEQKPKRL